MNSDIQIIDVLSDDPSDCSPIESAGDELADAVFVTVIALGVAEMVTTVLNNVAVLVTDCTSLLTLVTMVVDVELMSRVLITTDMVVSITAQEMSGLYVQSDNIFQEHSDIP